MWYHGGVGAGRRAGGRQSGFWVIVRPYEFLRSENRRAQPSYTLLVNLAICPSIYIPILKLYSAYISLYELSLCIVFTDLCWLPLNVLKYFFIRKQSPPIILPYILPHIPLLIPSPCPFIYIYISKPLYSLYTYVTLRVIFTASTDLCWHT